MNDKNAKRKETARNAIRMAGNAGRHAKSITITMPDGQKVTRAVRHSEIQDVGEWARRTAADITVREIARLQELDRLEAEAIILDECASGAPLKIEIPPGFKLADFLGHLSRKDFRERVIEATHAELIAEYEETLAAGDLKRAKYQRRMISVFLIWATIGGVVSSLWSKLSVKVVSTPD